jgi:hypothetical protein
MKRSLISTLLVCVFVALVSSPTAFSEGPPPFFAYRAINFDQTQFAPLQQKLLSAYLEKSGTTYDHWTTNKSEATSGNSGDNSGDNNDSDGMFAAFLGITHALTFMQIHLQDGRWITSDQMLVLVNSFEGDRLMVQLDSTLFDSWRAAGEEFILTRSSGEVEQGTFGFDHGDLGGSLHEGSTIQGYTSYYLVPRIQINYNEITHEADIDLDGYAPWINGIIPNPRHMTWENSDIRYWMDEYQQSFGNPGFQVVPN